MALSGPLRKILTGVALFAAICVVAVVGYMAAGDVVIVLGHDDDIPELAERFSAAAKRITYRGVTLET